MPSHPLRGSSPEGRARGRYRPPQGRHAASGGSSVISVKRTIFRAATPQAAGGRPLRVPRNAAFYCRDRRPRRSVISKRRAIFRGVKGAAPYQDIVLRRGGFYIRPRYQKRGRYLRREQAPALRCDIINRRGAFYMRPRYLENGGRGYPSPTGGLLLFVGEAFRLPRYRQNG